jgi:hypothetical protein
MSKADPFWKILLGVVAFVVILGAVGHMDMEDEEAQSQLYCDMVREHLKDSSKGWPDYDGTFQTSCQQPRKSPACFAHGGASANPQCGN